MTGNFVSLVSVCAEFAALLHHNSPLEFCLHAIVRLDINQHIIGHQLACRSANQRFAIA